MRPSVAVLRSYWLDSTSGLFLFAMYLLILCAPVFGDAPADFILLDCYMAVVLISSRLRSTRGYSLAYILPGYRAAHLRAASALIILFAWLPAVGVGLYLGTLLDVVALGLVVTGLVLAGEYRYRKLYSAAMFMVFITIMLVVFVPEIKVRWAPGTLTDLILIVIGLALLVHFVRIFLNGDEYSPGQMGSLWFESAGSAWVMDRSTLSRKTELAGFRAGGMGALRRMQRLMDQHRQSGRGPAYLARLIDVGVGDWLRWQAMRVMTIAFCVGVVLVVWLFAPEERFSDGLPRMVAPLMFVLQIVFSIAYVANPKWSLSFIWTRLPVVDKAALRKTYWMNQYRHVAVNYVLVCGFCITFAFAAQSVQDWLDIKPATVTRAGSEVVPLGTYVATMATWALAVTVGGMGVSLILNRWKLTAILSLIVGTVILVLWVGFAAWVNAPFQENTIGFSVTLLGTAFACFIPVAIWRYRSFYEHLDQNLSS